MDPNLRQKWTQSEIRLFQAGTGNRPPYLAGRAEQQQELKTAIEHLVANASPEIVCLYGPRGVGKTVLLDWMTDEAIQLYPEIQVFGNQTEVVTLESLWSDLTGKSIPIETTASTVEKISGSGGIPSVLQLGGGAESGEQTRSRPEEISLTEALKEASRSNPVLVGIDEAHELDSHFLRILLNAFQKAKKDSPVLLVLAGTPELEHQLAQAKSTFWERTQPMPVGLLPSDQDVEEAIRVPLEALGWSIEGEALRTVVEDSERYPYFVQLWGQYLWEQVRPDPTPEDSGQTPEKVIRVDDVKQVWPKITNRRSRFYRDRMNELERNGILGLATGISHALGDRDQLARPELDDLIRQLAQIETEEQTAHCRNLLAKTGFLWEPGIFDQESHSLVVIGIPSIKTALIRNSNRPPDSKEPEPEPEAFESELPDP